MHVEFLGYCDEMHVILQLLNKVDLHNVNLNHLNQIYILPINVW